jgi:hypothetical protein
VKGFFNNNVADTKLFYCIISISFGIMLNICLKLLLLKRKEGREGGKGVQFTK